MLPRAVTLAKSRFLLPSLAGASMGRSGWTAIPLRFDIVRQKRVDVIPQKS
jgi:hypothetical protein